MLGQILIGRIEPEDTVLLIDIHHTGRARAQSFEDMEDLLNFYRQEAKSTEGAFEAWCHDEQIDEDDPSSFEDWHNHDLHSSHVFQCKTEAAKGEYAASFESNGGHGHDAVRTALAFWKSKEA